LESNASKSSRIPQQISPVKGSPAKGVKDISRPPANSAASSPPKLTESVAAEKPSDKETAANSVPAVTSSPQSGGFRGCAADNPVAPRRPMPSPPPIKERPKEASMPKLANILHPSDMSQLGSKPPGREERRWIEAAVRRMFRSLGPAALEDITEAFREWKLPPGTALVEQGKPVSVGPGLCVLFEGVVDVLNKPMGGTEYEKVCTYDRCGQCFGELELFYDAPRGGSGRKRHWATTATRTPVTLWMIHRDTLRGIVPGCAAPPASASGASKPAASSELSPKSNSKGSMAFV